VLYASQHENHGLDPMGERRRHSIIRGLLTRPMLAAFIVYSAAYAALGFVAWSDAQFVTNPLYLP
jgi:hypothetical protein